MAQTRKDRIERLVRGIEDGGGSVAPGLDAGKQPMQIGIDGVTYRVFSWAITHGGRGRSKEEYRVQTTRPGEVPFLDLEQRTLLLGYFEELDVFAAWDVRMHPSPSVSDSLQVPLSVLRAAAEEGFVSRVRAVTAGDEIVVAFQPEAIGTYLETAVLLPGSSSDSADIEASAKAARGEAAPLEELPEGAERRREIREIEVKVRDQRFRRQVIAAYGGRCAFCGLGAGLIEAAHIEGVGEGGPDLIVNGLGACPTHHSAFDRGLIVVEEDYSIEVNEEGLRARGADEEDVDGFRGGLFASLTLPTAAENHPAPDRLASHRERWLAG